MDELRFYTAEIICAGQGLVRALLDEWGVEYREVDVSRDEQAAEQLRAWTGTLRVPTLALVAKGDAAAQPRAVLVEPRDELLKAWLARHSLLPEDADQGGT